MCLPPARRRSPSAARRGERVLELEIATSAAGDRGGAHLEAGRALVRRRAWPRPSGRASSEAFRDSGARYLDAAQRPAGDVPSRRCAQSLQDVGLRVQEPRARAQAGLRRAHRGSRSPRPPASGRGASRTRCARRHVRGRWGEVAAPSTSSSSPGCWSTATSSPRRRPGTPRATSCGPTSSCASRAASTSSWTAKVPLAAYLEAFETDRRGGAIAPGSPRTHGRCATTSTEARREELLAPVLPGARLRRDVRPRRDAAPRGPRARPQARSRTPGPSGVVLASPSTLMTLLRTVAAVWQQETVARERAGRARARRASSTSGCDVRRRTSRSSARSLDGAVGSYNEAVGSFESRVLVQARRLEEHGVAGIARVASRRSSARHGRSRGADATTRRRVVELPRDAHAA